MRTTLLIIGFSVLCIFLLARFVAWAPSDTPQTPVVERFLTFVEEAWRQPLRGPLRGVAALVLAIYFTILGIGPEKSWTLLKQSWPLLLVFGYYAAVYFLLPLLGFFIGLYIIVRFIKWAWYRK